MMNHPSGRFHKFGSVVRRRSLPGLMIVVIVALLTAAYAGHSPKRYSAELVFVVPAISPGQAPPGNPDQADKLATTFASLIPEDRPLLSSVAKAAHVDPTLLQNHVTVTNDSGTALVRVRYAGDSPASTTRVLNAFSAVLTSASPPGAIGSGTLQLVNPAQNITRSGHGLGSMLAVGLVAGIVLAVIAALALERSSPRVDSPTELADLTNAPVTTWRALTPGGISALVTRWRTMVALPYPDVALIGVGVPHDEMVKIADKIESRLSQPKPASRTGRPDGKNSGEGGDKGGLKLRIADMADPDYPGDEIAQIADMGVLIVVAGTPGATVSAMLRRLENYGTLSQWSIMIERSELRSE